PHAKRAPTRPPAVLGDAAHDGPGSEALVPDHRHGRAGAPQAPQRPGEAALEDRLARAAAELAAAAPDAVLARRRVADDHQRRSLALDPPQGVAAPAVA